MKNLDSFTNYFLKINEEVSNQTLYHYTTLSNLYLILKSDKMIARFVGDSSSDKWRKVSRKSISFCRKYLTIDLNDLNESVNDAGLVRLYGKENLEECDSLMLDIKDLSYDLYSSTGRLSNFTSSFL